MNLQMLSLAFPVPGSKITVLQFQLTLEWYIYYYLVNAGSLVFLPHLITGGTIAAKCRGRDCGLGTRAVQNVNQEVREKGALLRNNFCTASFAKTRYFLWSLPIFRLLNCAQIFVGTRVRQCSSFSSPWDWNRKM